MHNHPTTSHIDPRAEEMSARYRTGECLARIGADFGLTRERVRQIIRDHGTATAADARAARQADRVRARDALRAQAARAVRQRPGITARQLAEHLGVERSQLSSALDDETRALLVLDKHVEPQWTDEQILACLRRAAALYDGAPLTATRYRRVRRAVEGPTSVRILQRFGTWLAACEDAGVQGGRRPRRHYRRAWTEEELLGWVADYLAAPGARGTSAGYDRWARETDGAPSVSTVLNRLGSWAAVKRGATVIVLARRQARPTAGDLTLVA